MKQKCSKTGRRSGGFTLVELIVVIAILAILAGVAYPVYTGYINKANEAADLALLGQVNESFQSALYDVGHNDGLPETAAATLTEQKLTEVSSDGIDSLNAAFMKYFKGNENTPFKVYTGLGYDRDLGGFFGVLSDGTIALSNGWKLAQDNDGVTTTYTVTKDNGETLTYTVKNADLEKYKNSTFAQNMATSDLMDDVNDVADVFALFLDGTPAFKRQFQDLIDEFGITDEDPKKIGNALVIGVADATVGSNFDNIKSVVDGWANGGNFSLAPGSLTNTAAQLAMGYALVTAYANSEYGSTVMIEGQTLKEYFDSQPADVWSSTTGMNSFSAVQNTMKAIRDTPEFKEYYAAHGEEDINGYLAAMQAIHDNRDIISGKDGNNVVQNNAGFSDDDLGSILDSIFGAGG